MRLMIDIPLHHFHERSLSAVIPDGVSKATMLNVQAAAQMARKIK